MSDQACVVCMEEHSASSTPIETGHCTHQMCQPCAGLYFVSVIKSGRGGGALGIELQCAGYQCDAAFDSFIVLQELKSLLNRGGELAKEASSVVETFEMLHRTWLQMPNVVQNTGGLVPVGGLVNLYAGKIGQAFLKRRSNLGETCKVQVHAAVPHTLYYYYSCIEPDVGWGCTYRVMQMICSSLQPDVIFDSDSVSSEDGKQIDEIERKSTGLCIPDCCVYGYALDKQTDNSGAHVKSTEECELCSKCESCHLCSLRKLKKSSSDSPNSEHKSSCSGVMSRSKARYNSSARVIVREIPQRDAMLIPSLREIQAMLSPGGLCNSDELSDEEAKCGGRHIEKCIVGSRHWLEPPDCVTFFCRYAKVNARADTLCLKGESKKASTPGAVYEQLSTHFAKFRTPVMVDDKMFTYAIAGVACVGERDWHVLVFDPHLFHVASLFGKSSSSSLTTQHFEAVLQSVVKNGKLDGSQPILWEEVTKGVRWQPLADFFGSKKWMVLWVEDTIS